MTKLQTLGAWAIVISVLLFLLVRSFKAIPEPKDEHCKWAMMDKFTETANCGGCHR